MLKTEFPRFRLPSSTDSQFSHVRRDILSGGTGCLLLTTGDYDGDKTPDFAVVLTATGGEHWIAVIAARAPADGKWILETLAGWPGEFKGQYLNTLPSGTYTRTEAAAPGELEPKEMGEFTSEHEGVGLGIVESSAVAYFFNGREWIHVYYAD